jgi:hypothetical protein
LILHAHCYAASSPVTVLVLVSVCTLKLALFFVLVKAGKTLFVKHCGTDASRSNKKKKRETTKKAGQKY